MRSVRKEIQESIWSQICTQLSNTILYGITNQIPAHAAFTSLQYRAELMLAGASESEASGVIGLINIPRSLF